MMKTKVIFIGTDGIEEVLDKIRRVGAALGWSVVRYDPSQREVVFQSPYSNPNFGRLQLRFFIAPTAVNWFDPPAVLLEVKGGDSDPSPVVVGTTIINDGEYTFYGGESYFYILPPPSQTNNRRYGTLVSLLVFPQNVGTTPSQLGYLIWADRDVNTPVRRTDHGINLSSPDYVYVLPDGRRHSSLVPIAARELSQQPFSKLPLPVLRPLGFFGTGTILYPIAYTPELHLYIPPGVGGVPLALSSSIPDVIYVEGLRLEWVTVAPPLSLPVYGKD